MAETITRQKDTWQWKLKRAVWRLFQFRWNYLVISCGLKNLWRFRSAVWHFDRGDHSYLLALMRVATTEMSERLLHHAHCVGSEKRGREVLTVSELCRRLSDDEYFENAGYGDGTGWDRKPSKTKQRICQHAAYMMKQDAEHLGRLFRKVYNWGD